jgi:hypothetical protein
MKYLLSLTLTVMSLSALAQGNFLYTWHGDSSLFQASFEISADEQQPGAYFESGTLKNTFTVVAPDHNFPPSTFLSREDTSGFGPPLQLSVTMADPASGTGVHATSTSTSGLFFVDEYRLAENADIRHESGYWTFAQVPEPTTLTIVIIGLAALVTR